MDDKNTDRWSLSTWLVLAAVALVPAAFATAFSAFEVVKSAALFVLIGAALVAFGVAAIRRKPFAVMGSKIALTAYCFGLFALLAASWAPQPMLGALDGLMWVAAAAMFVLVVAQTGTAMRFVDFASALGVSGIFVGLSSILDAVGVKLFTPVWNPEGATGVFDGAEFLAPYAVVAMPILAAGVIRATGIRKVIAGLGLVAVAAAFGLTANLTFAGVAAGAVVVATLVVLVFQGFGRVALLMPALGVLVLAGAVAAVGYFVRPTEVYSDTNRLPMLTLEHRDTMDRIIDQDVRMPLFQIGRTEEVLSPPAYPYLFGLGLDMFRDKPIVGQGAGAWWQIQTKYSRPDDTYVKRMFDTYPAFQRAHNSYAELLAEYGLVGLLLFFGWLSSVFAVTLTGLARKEERERWLIEHWGLISGLLAGGVMAVISPAFDFAGSAVVFFPALGLLVRESAMLNDFKGISAPWRHSQDAGLSARFFLGAVPLVLGLGMFAILVPNVRSEYHRGLADHLMLRTRFDQAAEQYAKAFEAFPYRGELLYNQGVALRRTGKLDDAMAKMKKASELRPFDARMHVNLAQYAAYQNKGTEALTHARRSVELFRNYLDGRKAIAMAFDLDGRVEEASIEIKKTLDLEPPPKHRATLHNELARYYENNLNQPKLAIEHYQAAAKLMVDKVEREFAEFKAKELDKQVQRDRLMREGKPIPKELMPTQAPDHGHGPDDGHGHGGGLPVPKLPPGFEVPPDDHGDHDH